MFRAFMDNGDEFRYNNVYIEYECCDEPVFIVVKEGDEDPKLSSGIAFCMSDYTKEYQENWMKAMIEHISQEIEKNLEKTQLDLILDDIRLKVFDIGKPKLVNDGRR